MAKYTKQLSVHLPTDTHKTYLIHALGQMDMTFTEWVTQALRNQYINDKTKQNENRKTNQSSQFK